MSDVTPYRPNGQVTRQPRQVTRALNNLQGSTRVRLAEIEAAAEIEAVRVDAVTYVGRQAMQDIAMLSQLEQQLSALVPLAASRLQAIGDMTALILTNLVADAPRRLR